MFYTIVWGIIWLSSLQSLSSPTLSGGPLAALFLAVIADALFYFRPWNRNNQ